MLHVRPVQQYCQNMCLQAFSATASYVEQAVRNRDVPVLATLHKMSQLEDESFVFSMQGCSFTTVSTWVHWWLV